MTIRPLPCLHIFTLLALLGLGACAALTPPPRPPDPRLTPVTFQDLRGWGTDRLEEVRPALEAVAPKDKPEQPAAEAPPAEMAALVTAIKGALGPAVSDVRVSKRLTSSAVCLVASDGDIDINLERLLRAHKQLPQGGIKRVLEINPQHDLIRTLARLATEDSNGPAVQDMAHLLLDQARILEGEPLPDPVSFANRMTQLLGKGLAV